MKICHVPKSRGYSREFSGFATQGKALEEGLRLRAALLADKVSHLQLFSPAMISSKISDPVVLRSFRSTEAPVHHDDSDTLCMRADPRL